LDHTWKNILNKKQATGLLIDCIADHLPVLSCIELECPLSLKNEPSKQQRNFNSANLIKFKEKIQLIDTETVFQCTDANEAYKEFTNIYTKEFTNCFPPLT